LPHQHLIKGNLVQNKKLFIACLALLGGFAALADRPAPRVNIDRQRNSIFWEAQRSLVDAYQSVSKAQAYNHGELGDHAARAKDLLSEANEEIRLAAEYANHHR
jgi:hypothetical protein